MHLPYMKVAIYALTFLTYAYSGYGSHMITSLRDAIIAAEAIFGDVFSNLITVAKKFKIVHEVFDAAVDENCIYKCPGGGTPMRNKFYTPSSDGCGSLGLKINTEYLPAKEMEQCCNDHDICYDTCNSDKELCDLDFKRCLYKYCDNSDKSIINDLMTKGCKGAAKMLFTGTLTLGCKSYLDSQKRSCYCNVGGSYPNKNGNGGSFSNNKQSGTGNNYRDTQSNGKKNFKEKQKPPKYGWKDKEDL